MCRVLLFYRCRRETRAPHSGAALLCRTSVLGQWPKTLAEGELSSPEHLNDQRVEPPYGRRNHKKKDTPKGYSLQGHLEMNPRMTD